MDQGWCLGEFACIDHELHFSGESIRLGGEVVILDSRPFQIKVLEERHGCVGSVNGFNDVPILFQGRVRIRFRVLPTVFERGDCWGVIGGCKDA